MMRNFFKPTSNEQDKARLQPDSLVEEDLVVLLQNDLDEITEANKAMEYDSNTSNDDLATDNEKDEGWWGNEQAEENEQCGGSVVDEDNSVPSENQSR